jgi:hypothetical protein
VRERWLFLGDGSSRGWPEEDGPRVWSSSAATLFGDVRTEIQEAWRFSPADEPHHQARRHPRRRLFRGSYAARLPWRFLGLWQVGALSFSLPIQATATSADGIYGREDGSSTET